MRTADSSSPVVAVMQPAQALLADYLTIPQRTCPASRCLLFQPEVRSVFVIIGDVSGEELLQMSLVQRDYMVEQRCDEPSGVLIFRGQNRIIPLTKLAPCW